MVILKTTSIFGGTIEWYVALLLTEITYNKTSGAINIATACQHSSINKVVTCIIFV
jgi:hypothetical protein